MRILSRYLLARFAKSLAAVFVILTGAITVVDTMFHLDDLVEAPGGLRGAAVWLLLRIPSEYLHYLVPVSVFLAAFLALGTAARRHEIVAMKAGGVSPIAVLLPLLGAAALLSGASLVLNETLGVRTTRALQARERGGAAELTFRHGSFWYRRGDFVYNVQEADPGARTLRGVSVFELDRSGRLVRSVHAARAEIADGGDWRLFDATVRRFDPERPAARPEFEHVAETRLAESDRPDPALLQADVAALSIGDLREFLSVQDEDRGGTARARALLHERLSQPACVLLFALLAAPLGLRVERARTLTRPALHGVFLLFGFFLVRQYGLTFALGGAAPAAATIWGILAAFAAFGTVELLRTPR